VGGGASPSLTWVSCKLKLHCSCYSRSSGGTINWKINVIMGRYPKLWRGHRNRWEQSSPETQLNLPVGREPKDRPLKGPFLATKRPTYGSPRGLWGRDLLVDLGLSLNDAGGWGKSLKSRIRFQHKPAKCGKVVGFAAELFPKIERLCPGGNPRDLKTGRWGLSWRMGGGQCKDSQKRSGGVKEEVLCQKGRVSRESRMRA